MTFVQTFTRWLNHQRSSVPVMTTHFINTLFIMQVILKLFDLFMVVFIWYLNSVHTYFIADVT